MYTLLLDIINYLLLVILLYFFENKKKELNFENYVIYMNNIHWYIYS